MRPIFTTIGNEVDVMIIPDTKIHMDGHPVLTHNYHIYRDPHQGTGEFADKSADTPENRNQDADYFGLIRLEVPGGVYMYQPGHAAHLDDADVKEVVEIIDHYRQSPGIWVTE